MPSRGTSLPATRGIRKRPNFGAAIRSMAGLRENSYSPNPGAHAVYSQLYAEYLILHDYFGRGANDVMKRLKQMKMK